MYRKRSYRLLDEIYFNYQRVLDFELHSLILSKNGYAGEFEFFLIFFSVFSRRILKLLKTLSF